jgi:DNA-binding transcriptional ArsR family regulator
MIAGPDVSRIAQTIGDPTRIRMLVLLMEGRALTAKELAYGAGVLPATATSHLHKLLTDSLVQSRIQGRHKYFRLASPDVGRCIESLMAIAPARHTNAGDVSSPMRSARFCYDHLAGRLGVEITRSLLDNKVLEPKQNAFNVTRKGDRWLTAFGIDLQQLRRSRRKFAPLCLDWSERKDHIGGALGAAIAQVMLDNHWLRRKKDTRIVTITTAGERNLQSMFHIHWHRISA